MVLKNYTGSRKRNPLRFTMFVETMSVSGNCQIVHTNWERFGAE